MPNVFVSYRRKDSQHVTGRILDQLLTEFGEESVFYDLRSIRLGDDVRDVLGSAIRSCDVLLAVIGPDWEVDGRLEEEDDFVRFEVGAALKLGVMVIPILVNRGEVPAALSLPECLKHVARLNALEIRGGKDFHHDTERLLARLRELDDETRSLPSEVLTCPVQRQLVRVAIVRNGPADYTKAIARGFQRKADELFRASGYEIHFLEVEGDAAYDGDERNTEVFAGAVRGLRDLPHVLVTIGTGVSEFAMQRYADTLPIIFIGVADPVRSELARSLGPDPGRGQIAGTTYGISARTRLEFLLETFPMVDRFGFISNPRFKQDIFVSREVMRLAREELGCEGRFRVITVDRPELTPEQVDKAGLFFGFFYLNLHMDSFLASTRKPIVGLNEEDVKRGAIASTGNNDEKLGELAAREFLYPAIVQGKALCSRPIFQPRHPEFAINLNVARRLDITIPKKALEKTTLIVDEEA